MQDNMMIFKSNEFGQLGVLMIDEKPYFPATECAAILGYAKPENAISRHCKGSLKRGVPTNGGKQEKTFIPEGDLYRLIFRSKLPAAIRFEKFIMDEVLPSIRKYGVYISDDVLDQLIGNPEAAEWLFNRLKDERAKKEALEKYIDKLTPKAQYCDTVLQCPGAVLATVIAKDYGYSAIKFNKLLHALGVQFRYKSNKTWVLYQEHEDKGYTVSKTYHVNGKSYIQMCWTQRGRLWLYEYLKGHGVYPKAERTVQLENNKQQPNEQFSLPEPLVV